jgi:hypothetical protein
MTTVAFDTWRFSKRLKEGGVPELQTEAEALISEPRKDMEVMEKRLEGKLTMFDQRMTIKLGTLMVAAVCIVARLPCRPGNVKTGHGDA